MTKLGLSLALLLSTTIYAADNIEPPLTYTLQVADESIVLKAGESVELKGSFENPTVKLTPSKTRLFTYGGLTFEYPSFFAFEADFSDPAIQMWSLDGSDLVLMVYQYRELSITAKSLAGEMIGYYGEAAVGAPKRILRRFNGKRYKGYRITAAVGGSTIYQDILDIPTEKGTRLLMIQDMPADQKVSEVESDLVNKLLDETLAVSNPNP